MIFYYSGIENMIGRDELKRYFEVGYTMSGMLVSYWSLKDRRESIMGEIKRIKDKYGVKVMIDSGAYTIITALENMRGGKMTPSEEEYWKNFDFEKYFNGYLSFLYENKDAYDWAVELDIGHLVGVDKLREWRKRLIDSGLNIIFVYHNSAREQTIEELASMGVKYIGFSSRTGNQEPPVAIARKYGIKDIHFFTGIKRANKFWNYITSIDFTSWLEPAQYASFLKFVGGGMRHINLNGIIIKQMLADEFWDRLGIRREAEEEFDKGRYRLLNLYQITEYEKYLKYMNEKHEKKSKKYLEHAMVLAQQGSLPEWVNEKDKEGRNKLIYLASRENALKSGAYARELHRVSLFCDNCLVREECPYFEEGGICIFSEIIRKYHIDRVTNPEEVKRRIADIVAEKYARYLKARYFEDMRGGYPDREVDALENDLLRALELYLKVIGAMNVSPETKVNVLSLGNTVVASNMDEELEKIRAELGDEIAKRVKKQMEGGDENGGEEGGSN